MKKPQQTDVDLEGPGLLNSNVFGLRFTPQESNVIIIPVPWEPTVSYGSGTSRGPEHIRLASPQIDLYDGDLARYGLADPWVWGIHWEEEAQEVKELNCKAVALAQPVIADLESGRPKCEVDANLGEVNALSTSLNSWVEKRVEHWLGQNKIVGIVGGEHSVSFGAIAACAKRWPGMGVLHIDAHADLRQAYEGFAFSHASVMHNALARIANLHKVVQVGIRDLCVQEAQFIDADPRLRTWYDWDVRDALFQGTPFSGLCEQIVADLPQHVYVSFDIDGLDPALCPHTGTPVPGGLQFFEASCLLSTLARSGRQVVGFDLVEVAPGPVGEWDGNVGARMLYKLIGNTLLSQRVPEP